MNWAVLRRFPSTAVSLGFALVVMLAAIVWRVNVFRLPWLNIIDIEQSEIGAVALVFLLVVPAFFIDRAAARRRGYEIQEDAERQQAPEASVGLAAIVESSADAALRHERDRAQQYLDIADVITERHAAAAAQRASDERYRTLFEYAPDGIVIADRQSYYLDANASMCRMLGYTRDEFIGLHASDIVSPAEVPHVGEALRSLEGESHHHEREWIFTRKDGSTFSAEAPVSQMPDGDYLVIIRDSSEPSRHHPR